MQSWQGLSCQANFTDGNKRNSSELNAGNWRQLREAESSWESLQECVPCALCGGVVSPKPWLQGRFHTGLRDVGKGAGWETSALRKLRVPLPISAIKQSYHCCKLAKTGLPNLCEEPFASRWVGLCSIFCNVTIFHLSDSDIFHRFFFFFSFFFFIYYYSIY